MPGSPAFGQADLTNCERELIHLAGSIQPHGVLLSLREPGLRIVQASANTRALLGVPVDSLLEQPVAMLGGDISDWLARIAAAGDLAEPVPLTCRLVVRGEAAGFEGTVHRGVDGVLLVEIEPTQRGPRDAQTVAIDNPLLMEHVGVSIQRFGAASTISALADAVVRRFRDLIGYDRVMVYKFDPDGHGKIIAEARDPRLESLLGHHYPASDIPQRARELYLRNRLRVLVGVDDPPAPLVPRFLPGSDADLDMSMCHLRSMSPLHLQYLRNMGVTATLVVSLVREGRLWGLIACHHYAPRNLRFSVRAAADLLAEVASTRIAAIENYAHAQVAIQVRRLEQRLVDATATEGDWRLALFRHPQTLLQPLDATGAALFYDNEIMTSGEVPSTPELRALAQWVHGQRTGALLACSSVAQANPALQSLTSMASGVLAISLSATRPDYLMWLRKEQLLTVTWAGDPTKPVIGNDPLELSPRRSFAAWSELVRGTAAPWSSADEALARAFGGSLVDIILQVNAVRLLIARHQLKQTETAMASSQEAAIVVDAAQQVLFINDAFFQLARRPRDTRSNVDQLAALFSPGHAVRAMFEALAQERHAWRGQLGLVCGDATVLPVAVRAEVVPARDGSVLGFFLVFADLSAERSAAEARARFESSLSQVGRGAPERISGEPDALMNALISHAGLAAMDVLDGAATHLVAGQLEEIDLSTRRATQHYQRMRSFSGKS
jgi:light-regulated signal transduction histidine kinase (bacteriophytochrome)